MTDNQNENCIDCLRDCEQIGACCREMVLWTNGAPWPSSIDVEEAQRKIDERGMPFEILSHGTSIYAETNEPTGRHVWYVGCRMVMEDGLCGIYENRPDVCRIFKPGKDPLCVKHPDHAGACERLRIGRGEPVK